MNKDKAIIVLTNFWDANILIDYGYLFHTIEGYDKVYKVNLINENGNKNYTVNSIALSHPHLGKLANLQDMQRLDFFCPTYDMLCRYKRDGNWSSYTKDYYKLLHERKDSLKEWVGDLEPNHVYFLCCWENTISGSNCHRSLLYKRITSSSNAMAKILPIYRHGEKIYKEEQSGKIVMPTGLPSILSPIGYVEIDGGGTFNGGSSYITYIDEQGNVDEDRRGS